MYKVSKLNYCLFIWCLWQIGLISVTLATFLIRCHNCYLSYYKLQECKENGARPLSLVVSCSSLTLFPLRKKKLRRVSHSIPLAWYRQKAMMGFDSISGFQPFFSWAIYGSYCAKAKDYILPLELWVFRI